MKHLVIRTAALVLIAETHTLNAQTRPGFPPASLIAVAGEALANSHAYEYLEELCDSIGGRLNKMKAIGLQNVHEEFWQLPRGWRRISAEAELRSPSRQHLTVASLTKMKLDDALKLLNLKSFTATLPARDRQEAK